MGSPMPTKISKSSFTVEQLLEPQVFSHEVTQLSLLETHISWVVLTGPFAYKIKKPVTFSFVDYSTLEKRKTFCEREVELNRRFAPELYLGVVSIFQGEDGLQVGEELNESCEADRPLSPVAMATNKPIAYAVKMRQFAQDALVAAKLEQAELTANDVEQFGARIAQFHKLLEQAPPHLKSAQAARIFADTLDNFSLFYSAFEDDPRLQTIKDLEHWTREQFVRLKPDFTKRLEKGYVRRCHGDLHLKNVVQLDGQLVPFDGIEFNEDFQWVDVLSEIAFPTMDFVARGRPDLGWRFLNAYLEATGDYEGLRVFQFYFVYRAMVRAKVTWLNPKNRPVPAQRNDTSSSSDNDPFTGPWDKYLSAATTMAFQWTPSLSIMHGFSGSGKSTVALKVIEESGGIRIRSDVERHRLIHQSEIQEKYSSENIARVYARLLELAKCVLKSGLPVVIDATFLKRHQREDFESLCEEWRIPYRILDCQAPFEELCQRIQNRMADPSEATLGVLKRQMETHDPLTPEELAKVREF